MTRIEEIKEGTYNTGYNVQSSYGDAFIDGAQWADSHISDENIEKICHLFWKWSQYMSQTFWDKDTKENSLEYIKKHLNG